MRVNLAIVLFVLAGCSEAAVEKNQQSAELVACVPSYWTGALQYDGQVLRVSICVGDECSGEFDVAIVEGPSCLVEGGPWEGESSSPPPGNGKVTHDLSSRVQSESEHVGFTACALSTGTADGGVGAVQLELRVDSMSNAAVPEAGATATLQVLGEDRTVLVDSAAPIEERECPAFNWDLDGNAL